MFRCGTLRWNNLQEVVHKIVATYLVLKRMLDGKCRTNTRPAVKSAGEGDSHTRSQRGRQHNHRGLGEVEMCFVPESCNMCDYRTRAEIVGDPADTTPETGPL